LLLLRFKKSRFILSRPRLLSVFVRFGTLAGAEHKIALKLPLKTVIILVLTGAREITDSNVIAFEPLPQATRVFKMTRL
jgi:hypothetical protein